MNEDEEFTSTQPLDDDDNDRIKEFFENSPTPPLESIQKRKLIQQQSETEPLQFIPFQLISQRNSDLFINQDKNQILGLNSMVSKFDENSFSPEKLKECLIDIPNDNTNINSNNRNNNNKNISPAKMLDMKFADLDLFLSTSISNISPQKPKLSNIPLNTSYNNDSIELLEYQYSQSNYLAMVEEDEAMEAENIRNNNNNKHNEIDSDYGSDEDGVISSE